MGIAVLRSWLRPTLGACIRLTVFVPFLNLSDSYTLNSSFRAKSIAQAMASPYIKRRGNVIKRLLASNKMTISKAEQMLNSWKGHADFANSYNFTESLMAKSDFVYKDTKGRLRVDINKIKEGE